jgi:NADP-dependent 3-hydroxy acid dehydrogenase YdfG
VTTSTDLHGNTAIITGASRGIGLAAAQALAAAWITGETMVIDGGQRLGDVRPYRYGAMPNA